MVSAIEVVEIIQKIPAKDRRVRFLVSLANNAFKYGSLTEPQEHAFLQNPEEIKEMGVAL